MSSYITFTSTAFLSAKYFSPIFTFRKPKQSEKEKGKMMENFVYSIMEGENLEKAFLSSKFNILMIYDFSLLLDEVENLCWQK